MGSTFKVKVDDKEIELKVIKINSEIRAESQKPWGTAMEEALGNNLKLKIEIDRLLQDRHILDDDSDQKKLDVLRKDIRDLEVKLRKGVTGNRRMTKEEGKTIALQIKAKRGEIGSIGRELSNIYENTVENYASNEQMQYFIYACTVYADSGARYWKSYDDFKNDRESPVYKQAVTEFLVNASGVDKDYEKKMYENVWLVRMGYMNAALQLINDKGQLVDSEGRLINEKGQFINTAGELIDIWGHRVDEKGTLLEDSWLTPVEPQPVVS